MNDETGIELRRLMDDERRAAEKDRKPEQWILTVKRFAHDGGSLVVRCPHCKEVIGVDGDEGDDIRGEQFQHRSKRCDGWIEVWRQARRVAEV